MSTRKALQEFRRETGKQTMSYIMAAFGVVAGLAWNDAIKSFIEYIFPLKAGNIAAKFFYAILITIILVLITRYIASVLQPKSMAELPKK